VNNPIGCGLKDSRNEESKVSRTSIRKFRGLLREKPGRRATVDAGRAEPERVEPDPAPAEDEEGREGEIAISSRGVFVARAVDPQVVVVLQSFGMC